MTRSLNIKRFKVKDSWKDYEVLLEVNLDRLTPDRAELINNFWGGSKFRVIQEKGDVVKAVIRLAGQTLINAMLQQGGTDFHEGTKGALLGDNPGPIWTKDDLHNEEGWGGTIDEDNFGWCGIRVVAAAVDMPSYEDVAIAEVEP
ncbi:DUF2528 family protein [Pseudomonas inefficax]|uniref:DUF2528 family protein n=1 Tax=Pseudomonas inefficax TaxID=2078786 RepID=UPI0035C5EE00